MSLNLVDPSEYETNIELITCLTKESIAQLDLTQEYAKFEEFKQQDKYWFDFEEDQHFIIERVIKSAFRN